MLNPIPQLRQVSVPAGADLRGELLLTVHPMPRLLFDSLMVLTLAALLVAWLTGDPGYLPFMSLLLLALPAPLRFYENGVGVPDKWRRERLVSWDDVEAYEWEGSVLLLSVAGQCFPQDWKTFRYYVPAVERAQIRRLMWAHIGGDERL